MTPDNTKARELVERLRKTAAIGRGDDGDATSRMLADGFDEAADMIEALSPPIAGGEDAVERAARAIYGEFIQRTEVRVPRDIWPHLATAALSTLPQSIEPSEAMIGAGCQAMHTMQVAMAQREQCETPEDLPDFDDSDLCVAIYRAMCSAQGEVGNE